MEIQVSFKLSMTESAEFAHSALKKAKRFTLLTARFVTSPAIALAKEIDIQMTAAAMRNASRALLLEASENQNCVENAFSNTAESACE